MKEINTDQLKSINGGSAFQEGYNDGYAIGEWLGDQVESALKIIGILKYLV